MRLLRGLNELVCAKCSALCLAHPKCCVSICEIKHSLGFCPMRGIEGTRIHWKKWFILLVGGHL